MFDSQEEETRYYYILTEFEKLVDEYGVAQIMCDMHPPTLLALEAEMELRNVGV